MSEADNDPDNNIEVYKVIGAPGTGKTTRVVGNPELELRGLFLENKDKYPLEDQMFITYTNAGVDEATERLYEMTDWYKYQIEDRVTTIHSRCCSLLGIEYDSFVKHYTKQNFCTKFDIELGYEDDDADMMAGDLQKGNALFQIYGWLQSNMLENEDWRECPIQWEWKEDPEYLMDEWDKYKENNGYVGFGDMIRAVIKWGKKVLLELGYGPLFPDEDIDPMELFESARNDPMLDKEKLRGNGPFVDTRVLYVDEVQDLTAAQWNFYLLQKLVCDEIYIGGDDDQAIYGWSGADPRFMLEEEGEFEVLETTYRIPRNIWEACNDVIPQGDVRQEKEVTPDGEEGEFITLRRPSTRQLQSYLEEDNGDWLLLFRARYQIDEFVESLHQMGIPFRNMSTFENWNKDIPQLRDGLAKLENGSSTITGDELDTMLKYIPDEMIIDNTGMNDTEKVMDQFGGIDEDRLNETIRLQYDGRVLDLTPKNYLQICRSDDDCDINWYTEQAILGNIRNNNEHLDPERVRIGTIHSAKGKEADNVLLATDSTKTILENMDGPGMRSLSDEERRVYYVGMSRAAERLILAQGVTQDEPNIPINTLLSDEFLEDKKDYRGESLSQY